MSAQIRIICTVTNDLSYDQRMQRICQTLADAGYEVWLVGRLLPESVSPPSGAYQTRRLRCRNRKGFLFYAEFNVRLFFFLIFHHFDAVCTVDLDTMMAGAMAGYLKNKKRVFDAHEYFTEVPEVVGRRRVKQFWGWVERSFLPFYSHAYTVGPALAELFSQQHGIPFKVVRNVPRPLPSIAKKAFAPKILMYQGALNEGRGIEELMAAMRLLPNDFELHLAGEGDLSGVFREIVQRLQLENKVKFLGYIRPEALRDLTQNAWLGFNLLENKGLSYYYSLANKFFDFVQARVPIVTMDFPEYRALNNIHEVAVLLPETKPEQIADVVLKLANNEAHYQRLQNECDLAATKWHWENDKAVLLEVWKDALKQ